MRKKEAYLLWLWATREYCDLKVSNKVITESIQQYVKEASQHGKPVINTI